jgi:deoxyribodipyrimidine photolyase
MKIALLSAFVILACSGCTKNTVNQVNQVYSAVYTVGKDQWAQGQDPDGTTFYYTTLSVPELTQSLDVNGGVLLYLSFDDPSATDPIYEALPEVINGVAYGAVHTTGQVTIDLRAADGSNAPGPITGATLVKVVLLDASPLGN